MIAVMGATGHTGKKIAEALLEAGEKVRALGRSQSRLAELESSGAEVLTGDVADAAFLAKAFHGADAVYMLLPTDRQSAARRNEGLHAQEERLKRLEGTNVLLLRPVSFFENFYDALGLIKEQGINGDSVARDLAVPMVATRDIADVATKALERGTGRASSCASFSARAT